MELFCILFAKYDCPVAARIFHFLPTAHDCETGLLSNNALNQDYDKRNTAVFNPFTAKGEFD